MIGELKNGDRLGIRHVSGEWIPAEVVGKHERLGATLVRTIADPEPGDPDGVQRGVTLAIASWMQAGEHYKGAEGCEFRRKCQTCKGFGSRVVRQAQTLADALENAQSVLEVTCADCGGKGWLLYDPWKDDATATGDAASSPHGDSPV